MFDAVVPPRPPRLCKRECRAAVVAVDAKRRSQAARALFDLGFFIELYKFDEKYNEGRSEIPRRDNMTAVMKTKH